MKQKKNINKVKNIREIIIKRTPLKQDQYGIIWRGNGWEDIKLKC